MQPKSFILLLAAFLFAASACNRGGEESKVGAHKRSDYKVTEDFRAQLKSELLADPNDAKTIKLLIEINTKLLEVYSLWSPYALELLKEILQYDPSNKRAIAGYSHILLQQAKNYHSGDSRRYQALDEILKYDPHNKEAIEMYLPYLESIVSQYLPTDQRINEHKKKIAEFKKILETN